MTPLSDEDERMTTGNGHRNRVEVTITAEPHPTGYGQHMITVERGSGGAGDGEWVQAVILTDLELVQLAAVLETYQSALSTVTTRFADHSGREAG
jgi:hypothetical protein